MDNQQDRNYVSIGFWMLALFLMAIPCVGWVMIIVWAFAGENESRKNYFKALLLWTVILIGIVAALAMVGTLPEIMRRVREAMPK
jgi:hypothetical protein